MNPLLFRRQFLLTTKEIQFDSSWKKTKLTKYQRKCTIYSHPDLEITSATNAQVEIHLLGYALDPHNPEFLNQDIVNKLVTNSSFESLAAATDFLTGRFALVYTTADSIKVLHDPTGFREVYYYNNNIDFACGSTPNIIARYLSVERDDDEELNRFFNSPELNSPERKWIGPRTIYKGITKLMPNHYVDLIKHEAHRYWPRENRKIVELNSAVKLAARILTGTYDSAMKRFKLEQTLTSGWDTRLLLASCRKYAHKIPFYFLRGFKADAGLANSADYLITKAIAEKYNLPIQYLVIEDIKVDEEFERIYYENNLLSRPKLLKAYYTAYLNKLDDVMTISGTLGNSLLRLQSGINRNTDQAEVIARKLKYEKFPFIVDTINQWLDTSRHLTSKNYYIMDLFYWEQYLGNWGALSGTEQDIVRDELRPFNNRELITTLGGVHDKYRYRDYPLNYTKTIELLWPELLNFSNDISHYKLKKALRKINLEQLADRLYQTIRS